MNGKWPSFETHDLGPDDDAEMTRRWESYNLQMQALIATGAFHQDEDGWWVETVTGELVGPDPEIERPLSVEEIEKMVPFAQASSDMADAIERSRGDPFETAAGRHSARRR